ncbi:MAG: type II CAAX endopeptidase family protein [Caldisericia bacterium]
MKSDTKRYLFTLAAYLLVCITAIVISFSRTDIIGITFISAILILSIVFYFQVSTRITLNSFVENTFKFELAKSVIIFLLIFISRFAIYSITRGVWEKAGMIILFFMLVSYVDRNKLVDYGLSIKFLGSQLLWSLVTMLSVWGVYALSAILIPVFLGLSVESYTLNTTPFGVSSLIVLVFFLLGNFAEEIIFRGYIQTKLKRFGFFRALIIQAALFGLYHLNYIIGYNGSLLDFTGYIFFTFLFGIFMGLLFETTGSVIVTTITHAFMNFVFARIGLYPVAVLSSEKTFISPFTYGTTVVIMIVITGILVKAKNKKWLLR